MKEPCSSSTFLAYEDMKVSDQFYREVLGLPLIEDQGWAKVYRTYGKANVGIVEAHLGPVEKPVELARYSPSSSKMSKLGTNG